MRILRLVLGTILVSYTFQFESEARTAVEATPFLFSFYVLVCFALACLAGICSGLTVGYMSISKTQMMIWLNSDSPEEREIAKKILAILDNHYMLISTLLLANCLALEALPIFLDKVVPNYVTIITSTVAVVVLGQILPQAYCTGSSKIQVCYSFAPLILFLEWLLYVIVRPLSVLLDKWFGHKDDKIMLSPENLHSLLLLHDSSQYGYKQEQIKILQNTADLRLKKIKNYMLPLEKIFMVQENREINVQLLKQFQNYNYSRVPIFSKSRFNIVGFIKLKQLLVFKGQNSKELKTVVRPVVKLNENLSLLDAIDQLRQKDVNFAIVYNEDNNRASGMITLKKIFEKLVLRQFLDDDNHAQYKWSKPDNYSQGKEQQ